MGSYFNRSLKFLSQIRMPLYSSSRDDVAICKLPDTDWACTLNLIVLDWRTIHPTQLHFS